MLPIFKQYPLLKENLPYISLGTLPTRIIRLTKLEKEIGAKQLYLKQDGETGQIYGGNKIRKLEFLLGDAVKKQARAVLTFGYAGSNHALATSIYSNKLGLASISILLKQPNAQYVRNNLLMGYAQKADLCHYDNEPAAYLPVFIKMLRLRLSSGKFPYIIPAGGSSPLGIIGYVNAAFELKEQIEQGLMPEPDLIFVPLGTMGTAIGLVLGLKAANLKSRVLSVRVAAEKYGNQKKFVLLFYKTASLLSSKDPGFPDVELEPGDVEILHDYFGEGYAIFTQKGMEAVKMAKNIEDVQLEGTYTGKTMAAFIDYVKGSGSHDSTILFWNTYNSRDFSKTINSIDYHNLPKGFHQYF